MVSEEDPLEFEDWDGQSPFWIHCAAGSIAGVAEHVSVYPLDTVKTHVQCATCPRRNNSSSSSSSMRTLRNLPNGNMWTTMRHIVTTTREPGRLFRGVHTMLVGCVPAHALYFSSYELVKHACKRPDTGALAPYGGFLAGAAAVLGHDLIMTPLDTIKQRLQLGHYHGSMRLATRDMMRAEGGLLALYRSFPITLLTNLPYGAMMVSTNEYLKSVLSNSNDRAPSVAVCLVSSSLAGMVASLVTTPLDRIKTVLQIQQLQPCDVSHCPRPIQQQQQRPMEWHQVLRNILQQEGYKGLWRGALPRMLSHTPAVAISWTTYETLKQWLVTHNNNNNNNNNNNSNIINTQ